MNTLLLLLLSIFVGVALMVVLGQRFASPADEEKTAALARWIYPLVGVLLVLALLDHYVF